MVWQLVALITLLFILGFQAYAARRWPLPRPLPKTQWTTLARMVAMFVLGLYTNERLQVGLRGPMPERYTWMLFGAGAAVMGLNIYHRRQLSMSDKK